MKGRLAFALTALAALPPAYAAFVYGWQLVSFAGFAVRLEEELPVATWLETAGLLARMVVIAVALFAAWRAASRSRARGTLIALAAAWIAAAPLFLAVVRGV